MSSVINRALLYYQCSSLRLITIFFRQSITFFTIYLIQSFICVFHYFYTNFRLICVFHYFYSNFRLICESILTCDRLQYQNETFWCNAFTLVRKIIQTVDYKGVRDLLKIILDKVYQIPSKGNVSILKQLNILYQVCPKVLVFLLNLIY
jgi:hypothetical protein